MYAKSFEFFVCVCVPFICVLLICRLMRFYCFSVSLCFNAFDVFVVRLLLVGLFGAFLGREW